MITKRSKLFKQLAAIILTCAMLFGVNPLKPLSATNSIMNASNTSALKVDPKANTVEGFKATGANLYDTIKASMKVEEQKAVQNKDTDVIDVTKFGVIGDGVTQNAYTFRAALKEAVDTGKTLYFPDGVYDLSGYSSVTYNVAEAGKSISIRGQSRTNTKIINSPRINARMDLSVENITVSTDEEVFLWLLPTNFHEVKVNNVNFTGNSRKSIFIYASNPTETSGYSSIKIANCEVSNCKAMATLLCMIKSGIIEKNIVHDLGVLGERLRVYGIVLGFQAEQNVIMASANNVLIKDNYMKGFYNQIQNEILYDGEMRGILVYGDDATIEGNYLEDMVGGLYHDGIYTKGERSKIFYNTLYNVGDGQGSIVHKAVCSLEEDRAVIKGNRIILEKCLQDSNIHGGIIVQANRVDIIDNYVYLNHGMGISVLHNTPPSGIITKIQLANIMGNEVYVYGRNALQVEGIIGKIVVKDNNFTHIPNYEPIIPGSGIIPQSDSAVTLKSALAGSQFEISNNTINAAGAKGLNMFKIEDSVTAVINKNIVNVTEGVLKDTDLPQNMNYEFIDNVTNSVLIDDILKTSQQFPAGGGSGNSSTGTNTSSNSSVGKKISSSPSAGTNALVWKQDSTGWWLERQDGSYPVSQWTQKDGLWYYFDASGYMATGWQEINSQWYYLSNSGNMESNDWVYSNNYWYFLSEDGSMKVGWQEWKGSWYYLNSPNGEMAVNMVTPDGYTVDNNGIWIP